MMGITDEFPFRAIRRPFLLCLLVAMASVGFTGEIGAALETNASPRAGAGAGGPGPGPQGEFSPSEATLHRLTKPQLIRSWADVLGEPIRLPTDLPEDDVLYGFSSISAAQSTIPPLSLIPL